MINPLGPDFDWFRWHELTEIDRGYETTCWMKLGRPVVNAGDWHSRRLWEQTIGKRPTGHWFFHLCEIYGQPNQCVRPDHITITEPAVNAQHHSTLRVAAGADHMTTAGRQLVADSNRRRETPRDKNGRFLPCSNPR
jgi:hypothetical protein